MEDLSFNPKGCDFSGVHQAMKSYVDQNILAGVSHAVLHGRELLDVSCVGWADKEANVPLRHDHLFRVFSNTKIVTSCAVMMLLEEGRITLDDAIEKYIPQLGNRKVLKPGATSLDDTEPAKSSITIRHLLSHSSGLSYGLLDPGTLLFAAYNQKKVLSPTTPLSEMCNALADLPLAFHPGTSWEYSVATDVLGYLVEVVSGEGFDQFIQKRIFDRLGMADTSFFVPPEKRSRLAAIYVGADLLNPMTPGLTRSDSIPYPGAYVNPFPRLSGGGGLISTLPDMVALVRSLLPGGPTLLKAETIALMMSNHLPEGVSIRFATLGDVKSKAYGLGGAVTLTPSPIDPPGSEGEFQWGGIAGTHWWISPKTGLAGVLMTQRQMAFWHPFSFDFKQRVHAAVKAAG